MAQQPVWRVRANTRISWKQWGDDCVVFHENSGNTYQLNLFAATALRLLLDGPASTDTLMERTASSLASPRDKQLLDSISEMLSELKYMGLVKAVDA